MVINPYSNCETCVRCNTGGYAVEIVNLDYGDETNQEQMLVKTNLSKKEVSDIVEKIIEESKKLWNEEDEQYSDFSLSEIVVKKLKETFGKENVLQFEYLKFYW
ncbi:hypothetical protein [Thermoanaerobacter sp. RKWS2]|uniref:hypothetical protein n=1 Tax=Thermoanaerobacter sp. RKWS2 TaxID=2983842 RepID=UPI00224BA11D|nr:hypothetical protein [Thermoanaerobacter sp. RKWS2]UZQ81755.1 hypothetical protein OEI98_001490 [Thermoanaerobacter sp. RKWS2]